jgi:hypothetical protein
LVQDMQQLEFHRRQGHLPPAGGDAETVRIQG